VRTKQVDKFVSDWNDQRSTKKKQTREVFRIFDLFDYDKSTSQLRMATNRSETAVHLKSHISTRDCKRQDRTTTGRGTQQQRARRLSEAPEAPSLEIGRTDR